MRLVALAGFLVALLFIAYGVRLLGGFGAITPRLTVGRLRHELAEFSDDLPSRPSMTVALREGALSPFSRA